MVFVNDSPLFTFLEKYSKFTFKRKVVLFSLLIRNYKMPVLREKSLVSRARKVPHFPMMCGIKKCYPASVFPNVAYIL